MKKSEKKKVKKKIGGGCYDPGQSEPRFQIRQSSHLLMNMFEISLSKSPNPATIVFKVKNMSSMYFYFFIFKMDEMFAIQIKTGHFLSANSLNLQIKRYEATHHVSYRMHIFCVRESYLVY